MFLGIPDPVVWSGYVLFFISTVFCVIFGIINWNREAEISEEEMLEEKSWNEQEREIQDEVDGGLS